MKMQKPALITAMKNSISEVLETMFFLPIDFPNSQPGGEGWTVQQEEILTVRLDFEGPFSGYGLFYIPYKTALPIAADFLGMDEETVSADQVRETVLEITNMVVGNTLSFYDQQAVFNLKLPELIGPGEQEKKIVDSEEQIFIPIDTLENHLAFRLIVYP